MAQAQTHHRKGLLLISLFKFVKGFILLAIGIGALKLLHKDVEAMVLHYANLWHVDPDNKYFHAFIERLGVLNDRHLMQIGLGTFFYSGLLLTEGFGLYFEKRWAEYLTVIATSIFIPLEIYEIFHHFTGVRVMVLLVNAAIVAYLVWVIRRNHH